MVDLRTIQKKRKDSWKHIKKGKKGQKFQFTYTFFSMSSACESAPFDVNKQNWFHSEIKLVIQK